MRLEFRVLVAELQNVVAQILANRDYRTKRRDAAQILVSEMIATFRTTGSSAEIPIIGTAFGAACLPLSVMERMSEVAATFNRDSIKVVISDAWVQVESCKIKHTGIKPVTLQAIPDFNIDLPVDASLLDTLGLASLLTKIQIKDQGLTKRVEHAERQASAAIESAAHRLAEFGVSADELRRVVKERVREAGDRIAKTLGHEKLKRSTGAGASATSQNQPKLFE
jgi:predicted hydrocarbon binding protein